MRIVVINSGFVCERIKLGMDIQKVKKQNRPMSIDVMQIAIVITSIMLCLGIKLSGFCLLDLVNIIRAQKNTDIKATIPNAGHSVSIKTIH